MKTLLLIIALSASLNTLASNKKMLYGADDRVEIDSFFALRYFDHAKAVATMAKKNMLWPSGDGFKFTYLSLEDMGIPNYANFSRQPILGECTGFLVSEDILVTAGHCIASQSDCDDHLWVFDYNLRTSNRKKFKKKNSASCKEILETRFDDGGWIDYAIIRLEKKFPERNVLKLRKSGEIEAKTPVVMIGHPNGLPMKLTKNAEVWHTDDEWVFSANLDAYTGNSGSPVINEKTGEVEGILVRGGEDFVEDDLGNLYVNICIEGDDDELCTIGEDVTRITKLNLERFID